MIDTAPNSRFKLQENLTIKEDEKRIIEALKNTSAKSMRVIGRGTLVMDPKEVINSQKYKDLLAKADQILAKK